MFATSLLKFKIRELNHRGYTLIVVMMILILLSGLGIIAVNNVSIGMREANLQNLTENSFETTDSVVNLFSQYAGYAASPLVMRYNTDFLTNSKNVNDIEARSNWAYQINGTEAMNMMLGTSGTHPFGPNETWESSRAVDFDIVLRDLTDGIPAPGYSEEFCFKRVTIGGESRVGNTSSAGANGETFARTVTTQTTLIGPVRCASN